MEKPLWMWACFISIILVLLLIDLGIFHKNEREIKLKESLYMSSFYIFIAFLFGAWIFYKLGSHSFADYLTGFLVEKSLALDNIFLVSLIFSRLSIPAKYQHRVLFWGILGVIILRAIMIGLGAHLVSKFSWILYIFGLFIMFTGVKMLFVSHQTIDIKNNILLKWLRKHFKITDDLEGNKFFVYRMDSNGKKILFLTPLLVALVMIEFIDLIFAVDSIPAVFSITQDPYIVYTSNIFAVLGLRALYFALASMISKFYYLKYSLALVLIFIGSKIFIIDIFELEKFPSSISLAITIGLLTLGCVASLISRTNSESAQD